MLCANCQKPFDRDSRTPKLLPFCGHSICDVCLQQLLQSPTSQFNCPFDNISYEKSSKFSDNLYILEVIKNQGQRNSVGARPSLGPGRCKRHDRSLDMYCLNCETKICSECALFDVHRGHNVHKADVVTTLKQQTELLKYKKRLSEFHTLNSNLTNFVRELYELKSEKIAVINKSFESIVSALNAQKAVLTQNISQFYDSYANSFNAMKAKVESMEADLQRLVKVNEQQSTPVSESGLSIKLRSIDEYLDKCDVFSHCKMVKPQLEINFDWRIMDIIPHLCKINRMTEQGSLLTSQSFATYLERKTMLEEENLLHESLKELNAFPTEVNFSDDAFEENSSKIPTPNSKLLATRNYNSFIQPSVTRNYSPMNKSTHESDPTRSMITANTEMKQNTSMLSRKKSNSNPMANHNATLSYHQKLGQPNNFTSFVSQNYPMSRKNSVMNEHKSVNNINEGTPVSENKSRYITGSVYNQANTQVISKFVRQAPSSVQNSPHGTQGPLARSFLVHGKENNHDEHSASKNQRDGNHIKGKLIATIESFLKSKNATLDLSNMDITDAIITELLVPRISAMQNLRHLNLSYNSISDKGLKSILKAIKDLPIETLYITDNSLKDTAFDYLLSFRKYNGSLKAVYMANNLVNKSSCKIKLKAKSLEEKRTAVFI
jgi:hypothetical protein